MIYSSVTESRNGLGQFVKWIISDISELLQDCQFKNLKVVLNTLFFLNDLKFCVVFLYFFFFKSSTVSTVQGRSRGFLLFYQLQIRTVFWSSPLPSQEAWHWITPGVWGLQDKTHRSALIKLMPKPHESLTMGLVLYPHYFPELMIEWPTSFCFCLF